MAAEPLPATPGAWHRRIWSLTWPVILANITIPLVGTADVMVLGRLPDPVYIGAVTLGATLFSSVYWLFGFLRMGTTGLVAQAYGGTGRSAAATPIFARALLMALALGVLMVILQVPLHRFLEGLFQPAGDVAVLTETYYAIRIWGAPGLLMYMVCLGVLFGLQRMRDTLWLSIGLNVTNLSLDLLFVLGFDMNVAGVATGTVISEWGAALFGIVLVRRAAGPLRVSAAALTQTSELARLFSVSSNLIARTFFVQMPFLVGTALATRLGDMTLAAHGILMQMFFVMTYALDGFAHTAETLAGYTYGAKRPRELRQACIYASFWALVFALVSAVVFAMFGEPIIAQFTVDLGLRAVAGEYLVWLALVPLFCIWAFLLDGIFIGTTHIREMRNAMLLSALVWALVLYLTFDHYAYHAVWLAMNAFMLLRAVLLGAYYPRLERAAAAADNG